MQVILVGRHQVSGSEGFEVVEQLSINFPARSDECRKIIQELIQKAEAEGAELVFQAVPGQVAVAASRLAQDAKCLIGVIVSVPGERLVGVQKSWADLDEGLVSKMEDAIQFSNPRANIATDFSQERGGEVTVTVDPPMRFEFSHIEWFNW